ncbi:MAG: M48 family metalloprotease [Anaerolineae bacterium]|nr:M48 family metalloprotease [Anaerolineae bacterium]
MRRYYRPPRMQVRNRARPRTSRPGGSGGCLRLALALGMAAFALFSYYGSKVINPVTGEEQYITITQDQEIALGLQATPEMVQQFGGLHPDPDIQELVDLIGVYLVDNSLAADSGYPFEFYVLADEQTVNAFALPGGQIFVTYALLAQLETEDQLAGVIGHEIGHVVTRHGAERIAQMQLTQGLTGAVVLATYDPQDPSTQRTAEVALLIGQLVTMKWGREDELEADWLGVCILHQSGYDPAEMIGVMDVLEAAGGGQLRPPEFFSTHPNFDTRDANIQQSIDNLGSCP